ncbi:MAG: 30S ribosome-binding factor RbfA [Deltaproteobacteria bacterium]|nr:30S ribosome-binding factor RbfA [Deltaproteobacteria bacterium]
MTRRTERVGEEIRAQIARVLREEATDPRLRLVTLTRVDVAPDFARADVYWSVIEREHGVAREQTEQALEHAAGFLRRRLAEALTLRRMPSLHFHYDPSLALGSETLALLRDLRHDDGER